MDFFSNAIFHHVVVVVRNLSTILNKLFPLENKKIFSCSFLSNGITTTSSDLNLNLNSNLDLDSDLDLDLYELTMLNVLFSFERMKKTLLVQLLLCCWKKNYIS